MLQIEFSSLECSFVLKFLSEVETELVVFTSGFFSGFFTRGRIYLEVDPVVI